MNHHQYRPIAAVMAATVFLVAFAAQAAAPGETRHVRLSFPAAELQTEAGFKRVAARVNAAAERVCDTGDGGSDFESRTCEREAREAAMRELLAKRANDPRQAANTPGSR